MIVIGIDPGKKGAYAVIEGERVNAYPLPDVRDLVFVVSDATLVGIEQAVYTPKMGGKALATFHQGYGQLIGMLKAVGVPFVEIKAQTWKREILKGTAKDKAAAIEYVENRYPLVELVPEGCRKPHDGMADAVCIAEYAKGRV